MHSKPTTGDSSRNYTLELTRAIVELHRQVNDLIIQVDRSVVEQRKIGSPQESDEMPILGRFPKRDEFGLRRGDALRFEEQVA